VRVRGPAEGEYSHWCCNVKHAGDKPYHSYFTYRCVSSCPDEEQCVRPPSSEPETPLFNVPTCVDASQYADCTLCPDGLALDVTSGTCLTLETTPETTLEEVEVTTSADANMEISVVALFIALCLCVSSLIGCCRFIVRSSTKEQTEAYYADPSMMYPVASMHSKSRKKHRGAPMHSRSRKKHRGAPMRSRSRKKHRGAPMYEDPSMMYQDPSMMYQDPSMMYQDPSMMYHGPYGRY